MSTTATMPQAERVVPTRTIVAFIFMVFGKNKKQNEKRGTRPNRYILFEELKMRWVITLLSFDQGVDRTN